MNKNAKMALYLLGAAYVLGFATGAFVLWALTSVEVGLR